MRFKLKENFANESMLDDHFNKHWAEFIDIIRNYKKDDEKYNQFRKYCIDFNRKRDKQLYQKFLNTVVVEKSKDKTGISLNLKKNLDLIPEYIDIISFTSKGTKEDDPERLFARSNLYFIDRNYENLDISLKRPKPYNEERHEEPPKYTEENIDKFNNDKNRENLNKGFLIVFKFDKKRNDPLLFSGHTKTFDANKKNFNPEEYGNDIKDKIIGEFYENDVKFNYFLDEIKYASFSFDINSELCGYINNENNIVLFYNPKNKKDSIFFIFNTDKNKKNKILYVNDNMDINDYINILMQKKEEEEEEKDVIDVGVFVDNFVKKKKREEIEEKEEEDTIVDNKTYIYDNEELNFKYKSELPHNINKINDLIESLSPCDIFPNEDKKYNSFCGYKDNSNNYIIYTKKQITYNNFTKRLQIKLSSNNSLSFSLVDNISSYRDLNLGNEVKEESDSTNIYLHKMIEEATLLSKNNNINIADKKIFGFIYEFEKERNTILYDNRYSSPVTYIIKEKGKNKYIISECKEGKVSDYISKFKFYLSETIPAKKSKISSTNNLISEIKKELKHKNILFAKIFDAQGWIGYISEDNSYCFYNTITKLYLQMLPTKDTFKIKYIDFIDINKYKKKINNSGDKKYSFKSELEYNDIYISKLIKFEFKDNDNIIVDEFNGEYIFYDKYKNFYLKWDENDNSIYYEICDENKFNQEKSKLKEEPLENKDIDDADNEKDMQDLLQTANL